MKSTKKSDDGSCSRPNEIMKTPVLRKSNILVLVVSLIDVRVGRKQIASFIFWFSISQCSLWIQQWWGLRNRQWWTFIKQLSKCLSSLAARRVLLISKRQYTSSKPRGLIIEDEFENTYFCWLLQTEKFTRAYLFQIALEIMWLPIHNTNIDNVCVHNAWSRFKALFLS